MPAQIGWGAEDKLLYRIKQKILRDIKSGGTYTPTTTTTSSSTTTSTTTSGGGGSLETVIWNGFSEAFDGGSGRLDFTTATAGGSLDTSGAMSIYKITKANGNYVQWQLATLANSEAVVVGIATSLDAKYGWSSTDNAVRAVDIVAGGYVFGGNYIGFSGDPDAPSYNSAVGAATDNRYLRLEIANTNDVILKESTDGITFGTTLHTFTGALTGYSNLYVRSLNALKDVKHILNAKVNGATLIYPTEGYIVWDSIGKDFNGPKVYNSLKGIYNNSGASGWLSTADTIAVSDSILSTGKRLKVKVTGTAQASYLNLSTNQTPADNTGTPVFPYAVYIGYSLTNNIAAVDTLSGIIPLGQSYSIGDWFALFYDGALMKIQYSTNGTTWSTIHTFAAAPSGSYYTQVQFYSGSPNGYTEIAVV